eukprot:m.54298 g.54298  ORF g.54298 m.54298 type:complete len:131 (-) comp10915_c0_seq2:2057-2449(-)
MSFVQRFIRAVVPPRPLPNRIPLEQRPKPKRWNLATVKEYKEGFTQRWVVYKQGLKEDFLGNDEDAKNSQEWEENVREQSAYARNLYEETKKTPETAKTYFAAWINVYRTTISEFLEGYKEGQKHNEESK